jgi:hypothetical protein
LLFAKSPKKPSTVASSLSKKEKVVSAAEKEVREYIHIHTYIYLCVSAFLSNFINPFPCTHTHTNKHTNTQALQKEVAENDKEVAEFWICSRPFRAVYISTRCLRRIQSILPMLSPDYKPKGRYGKKKRLGVFHFYTNPVGGLGSREKLQAAKDIESIFYRQVKQGTVPRFMDPSQGMFWITNTLMEYIYQATFFGGGFNRDAAAIEVCVCVCIHTCVSTCVSTSHSVPHSYSC